MALSLARGETVLFPMPYVEAERPRYIVTNQRLIEQGEQGERVLAVKQLVGASRAKSRPFAATGVFLLCLALISAGIGAYLYVSVLGMDAGSYKALLPTSSDDDEAKPDEASDPEAHKPAKEVPPEVLPDDPSAEHAEQHPADAAWSLTVLKTRLAGGGLVALGALLGMIGLKILRKQRYFVVCRTRESFMRIRVNDKVQQDIILATLQAVQ